MATRKPDYVYDVGDEPDPRFSLANERTFLAWVRTAMALMAGGIALHSLNVVHTAWLRTTVALALLALGAGCTSAAYLRWRNVERAMRLREPLPHFNIGLFMTAAVVVIAIALAALVAF
jgi:putative membrane protein